MDKLTYVSIGRIRYEGEDIVYAGSEIDIAFRKIKELYDREEGMRDFYFVDVWKEEEIIYTFDYDDKEDEFKKSK